MRSKAFDQINPETHAVTRMEDHKGETEMNFWYRLGLIHGQLSGESFGKHGLASLQQILILNHEQLVDKDNSLCLSPSM